ncbi:TOBE domain-containing protein, partial [Neorhizobium sp. BETTINA12A]|uniref:TOBE domain-containing protein n=1 Tax=Neorhizobium sp. BETTINA12A TaxID=2908924 RepID=UPI001FF549FD
IAGTVTFIRDLGGAIETFVEAGGSQVIAVSSPRNRPEVSVGQSVGIRLDPATSVVLAR